MPDSPPHSIPPRLLALLLAGLPSAAMAADEAERRGFGVQPIIGYDDETSWTLGANSAFYFNPDPRNDKQEFDLVTGFALNADEDVQK
ncbi:MAG: hypothetical protein LAO21_03435 [Acidobacteriia bacterium]|nr:hypothetical protein [Terriglobia bacterium]